MDKILTAHRRSRGQILTVVLLSLAAGALALWWAWSARSHAPAATAARDSPPLRATLRNEPRSFNRLASTDYSSLAVSWLLNAPLVTLDPQTFDVVPALAESWTPSADGRRWTVRLRRGIRFSDGSPLTAADVLFTLEAIHDARVASSLAGALEVGGAPLVAEAPDAHTVILTAAAPLGAGLRLLVDVPILPKHKLEAALEQGTFREAWTVAVPPGDLAGLGPFVLRAYQPGARLTFGRNPHYWQHDDTGRPLPYVDELVIDIVPNQNAEVLRLFAGQSDLMFGALRPEDLSEARRLAEDGRLALHEAGVGLDADFLWFNLIPGANPAKPWLQRLDLRRAVSRAVDRQALVDTVYLGEGVPIAGPITPGNHAWFADDLPVPRQDVARARQHLASAALRDRDGDGLVETEAGEAARITLLTQQGNTLRERGAAVIQQDLHAIGLAVDVVALDQAALIDRLMRGEYEAIYFAATSSDTDPASNLDFWLSRGMFHAWNPGQEEPATAWEAEIDRLMLEQAVTLDRAARARIFNRVQHIFAEHVPALFFAAPRLTVATSARVRNVTPGPLHPYLLWQAANIQLRPRPEAPPETSRPAPWHAAHLRVEPPVRAAGAPVSEAARTRRAKWTPLSFSSLAAGARVSEAARTRAGAP